MVGRPCQIDGSHKGPPAASRDCPPRPQWRRGQVLRHDRNERVPTGGEEHAYATGRQTWACVDMLDVAEKTCLRVRKHGTRLLPNPPSFQYSTIPFPDPAGQRAEGQLCRKSQFVCRARSVAVRPSGSTGILPMILNHGRDAHATGTPDGVTTNWAAAQNGAFYGVIVCHEIQSHTCEIDGMSLLAAIIICDYYRFHA